MTMKELAKLCNVSVSSVSKAFCEADDISVETKQLIFDTAKEYGCFGKFYKGKYHKKIIAVICPELIGGYYSIFINKLQELIEAAGAICTISTDNFSTKKQTELIEYYASYLKVDGLIVFNLREMLKKGYDIPIVSLFSSIDSRVDSVDTDMSFAIEEAVKNLYSYGHNSICFLGEDLTKSKAEYFQKAMKNIKDSSYNVIESDKRFEEAGIDGINKLIKSGTQFTAVICAYDNIAFGAIKQLKKLGYQVPQDVSVIGINNISTSCFTETSLTTIDTTPDDICSILWELLGKKLKNKYFRINQSIIVKPRLIIRDSIGKVKQ